MSASGASTQPARPAPHVLDAFGAAGTPIPLPGGQGGSWRCGDLVLKPLDGDVAGLEWAAETLRRVRSDRVRLPVPVRAADGSLVLDGWTATTVLPGEHRPGCWAEVIAAGEAFAGAVAHLPEPAFLAERCDPWAVADRVAWGEARLDGLDGLDGVPHVRRLRAALAPVRASSQLVHGDLTGNVLLHPALPPAVIDLSLYWRPVAYGSAVVIADALAFEGGTLALLDVPRTEPDLPQLVLRALLARIVTDHLLGVAARPGGDPYAAAVEAICAVAARR
ncbi:TIGR02569 family protein [Cellulomonas hominis]|uniref:TIGR02569 family protein n=1 Tax=Cellulomonas hominis TaxID=156981 RepID=UPI001B8F7235|nr:TIGR02569 family protein [Cellulomonas hominis]VTR78693.1 hypothetical protein CHMI_03476 [Cellulomonas hominis]